MPLYRPIRTTATAVPDALAGLRSDISTLASATSGQINGTVQTLRAAVRAIPIVTANVYSATGWTLNSSGTTVLSKTIPVRAGQDSVAVMAQILAKVRTTRGGLLYPPIAFPSYSIVIAGETTAAMTTASSAVADDSSWAEMSSYGWAMTQAGLSGQTSVPIQVVAKGSITNLSAAYSSLTVGIIAISTASV